MIPRLMSPKTAEDQHGDDRGCVARDADATGQIEHQIAKRRQQAARRRTGNPSKETNWRGSKEKFVNRLKARTSNLGKL